MTVAALRERGIDAPAQAIYTLQLAGYAIDRLPGYANGRAASVYRLRGGPEYGNGRSSEPGRGSGR